MKRYFKLLIILCLCSIAISAIGQEIALPNASFEKTGKGGLPEGWGLITKDGQGQVALDLEVVHSGKNSLRLSGVQLKDKAGVVLYVKLPPKESWQEKTFKASIWYRTEQHQGTTMFKVEGINKERTKNVETYNTLIPAGTINEWQKAEVKFKVKSPETAELWLNLYMREGCGKVWFDDLTLELIDEELQTQAAQVAPALKIDFENDPKGSLPEGWVWILHPEEGTGQVTDDYAQAGKHSLKLASSKEATAVRIGTNPIKNFPPQAGKRYLVRSWCRSEDLYGDLWLKLEFVNKERNKILGTFFLRPLAATCDWYLLEGVTDLIPEGTAEFWLNINVGGKGPLWLDEIEINVWEGTEEDLKEYNKAALPNLPAPTPDLALRHPSIYITRDEVAALRALRKESAFKEIADSLLLSADKLFGRELPAEPEPYPNGWEVDHWRKMRNVSSLVSGSMEKLGFAYLITGDRKYAEECKRWINLVCSWDVNGTTSTKYHDDLGRWLLWNMGKAVDWIYDTFTLEELAVIRPVLLARGRELYDVQVRPLYGMPYDSHAVSAVCYLTCAGLAISDLQEAQEWLNFSANFYRGVYPPWGGKDGGWSEGVGYWKWSMTEALEAAEILKVAGLADVYGKDWYQNTIYFKIYFDLMGNRCANAFGDGAYGDRLDAADYTAAYMFAGVTQNPHFKWYAQQINSGFTNRIIEYFYRYRYGEQIEELIARPPYDLPRSKAFYDIGWAALHSDLINAKNDVSLFLKSSPMGSWSHSHGEQNSFTLTAFGEPLAISSGYYDWYGSPHHFDFTRQSRSKNTILVNGQGQHYRSRQAAGEIVDLFTGAGFDLTIGEAGTAYEGKLNQFTREILYSVADYFIVMDYLSAPEPSYYNWLFHTIAPIQIDERTKKAELTQNGVNLELSFLVPNELSFEQTDRYYTKGDAQAVFKEAEVVPETDRGKQYHLAATTAKPASEGRFITVLYPYKGEKALTFTSAKKDNSYQVMATGEGRRDLTLISLDRTSGQLTGQGMEAQGTIAAASWQNAKAQKLFLSGTFLKLDTVNYLSSDKHGTFTVEYLSAGEKVVVRLAEAAQIAVRLAGRPQEVELDGKRITSYVWEDGLVKLQLAAGDHTLYFRHLASIGERQTQIPCCVAGKDIPEFNLDYYSYSNGDSVAFGNFPGRGVYNVTVCYQDLTDSPSKIEFLAGSDTGEFTKLPAKDGWQRLEYRKIWIMDESNITVKADGNGLGQNFIKLGKLIFNFDRDSYDFPIKLDFEQEDPGTFPAGWSWIVRSGQVDSNVDTTVAYSGRQSLKLTGSAQDDHVRIGTNPIAGFYPGIGKQYKIKVWCRSEEIAEGSWIKIEFINKGRNKVLGNFFLYPEAGSHDWYLLEGVTSPMPEDTAEFWLNIDLPGAGSLWLDDFEVQPVE
jgi:hypothetical protein